MKQPAVYILASDRNGTLYAGVTSDLLSRTWQHREHLVDGFTKRYDVTMLVWYELHATMDAAITREKQIKKWNRAWKLRLIQEANPRWRDFGPTSSDRVRAWVPAYAGFSTDACRVMTSKLKGDSRL